MALAWLLAALALGGAAVAVGWPAWRDYRAREGRNLNAERYNAWRGRASRPGVSLSEGPTQAERRRFYLAAAAGAGGVVCLIVFFAVS
jgi:hypothetical protein